MFRRMAGKPNRDRGVSADAERTSSVMNTEHGFGGMTTKEYFLQIAEFYAAGLQSKWSENEGGAEGKYAATIKELQGEIVASRMKKLDAFKAAVEKIPGEPQI